MRKLIRRRGIRSKPAFPISSSYSAHRRFERCVLGCIDDKSEKWEESFIARRVLVCSCMARPDGRWCSKINRVYCKEASIGNNCGQPTWKLKPTLPQWARWWCAQRPSQQSFRHPTSRGGVIHLGLWNTNSEKEKSNWFSVSAFSVFDLSIFLEIDKLLDR